MPFHPDVDMSHFDIGYWDGLGAHRMLDTKDRADGEEEACISGVVEITYDREDRQPFKIETGVDTLKLMRWEKSPSITLYGMDWSDI
jgi:hypothetical protein